jgi:alpha-tubulin suppressor-like RCC1 family protein
MIASSNSFLASVDTKGQVWISGMFAEVVDKPDRYKMQILEMQIPTRIIFVAAGFMHCLALSEDMHVFAAGKNWSGQLGVGNTTVKYMKQLSRIAAGPWDGHTSMIACGACFSAILTDDGCIRTFGQYTSKCLGIVRTATAHLVGYTSPNVFEPTLIDACNPARTSPAKLPAVEFLSAGVQHVNVIANGELYAWGQNCCGQLGIGWDFQDQIFPMKVGGEDVFGSKVRLVAANDHHTLVLTENRDLWAYGNCEQGRLGLDGHENCKFVMSPQMLNLGFFDSRRIACIAAGKGHSAVLTEDGNLYTWGQGRLNEWKSVVPSALGYAKLINFQSVPRLVEQR